MDRASKSGFVIKLSSETVLKLSEEKEVEKEETENSVTTTNDTSKIEKEVENVLIVNIKKSSGFSKNVENLNNVDNENSESTTNEALDIAQVERSDTENKTNLELTSESSKDNASDNNDANLHDSNSWGDYAPHVSYIGELAIYTDPSTQQKYSWNKESNSWSPMSDNNDVPGRLYSYEDDTHIYTEADGSKFFWDDDKKAWIPKVDDDFLAMYQMSYGFVDNSFKNDTKNDKQVESKKTEVGVKRKNDPQWFEQSDDKNTKVYVSNLPLDTTEEEFVDLMQKCGLVERDPSTQKMKVKLYMDKEQNCFKGDALCTYIKIESVDLALKLIDGSDFKGQKIKVEKAHFQLKGEYNPALKPKKKKKKELEKIKKMQQKLFDWRPEKFIGERSKHERIVIVKNLFQPSDFDKEVQLILDYQQDLREECSKCGEVRKVVIYDRHPEGVAQITMKEPEQADAVIELINGRWFGKRQITAETYDGRTKYRIAETDADISKRIDKWDKFLEGTDAGAVKEMLDKNEKNKKDEEITANSDQPTDIVVNKS